MEAGGPGASLPAAGWGWRALGSEVPWSGAGGGRGGGGGWDPKQLGCHWSQEHWQVPGLPLLGRPSLQGCFGNPQVQPGPWGCCLEPGALGLSL